IPIAIVLVVVLETQRIRERERGGGRIEFACGLTRLVRFGLICVPYVVGYPSGQRGQTVNLLAMPSMVRIHHLPPFFVRSAAETKNAAPKSREADEGGPMRQQYFELRPGRPPLSIFDSARAERCCRFTIWQPVAPSFK